MSSGRGDIYVLVADAMADKSCSCSDCFYAHTILRRHMACTGSRHEVGREGIARCEAA